MNDNDNDKSKTISDALVKEMGRINSDLFYCAFKEYFENRADFDTHLDNLNNEKEKIIRLGFFYYVVTKDIKHAGVTLISLFSIMEATAYEKFQPFDQWLLAKIKEPESISFPLSDRQDFKSTILSFQRKYYEEHGSSEKVRKFINNYFSPEDKQKLIGGFQIKDSSLEFTSLNFECRLKAIVDMLYKERNAFVHEGKLPQITDKNDKMLGYCKIKNKNTFVTIQISINEIQKMFEKAFVNFVKKLSA